MSGYFFYNFVIDKNMVMIKGGVNVDVTINESSNKYEGMLDTILKIPGVKVDREQFLLQTLSSKIKDGNIINLAIETDPITAGIAVEKLDKIAKSLIKKRTENTSIASFAAGIPGGIAMAATIPADTIQFLTTAIKLAQELVYLYGYGEIGNKSQLDEDIKRELIIYLGVMLGVEKSASALRVLTSKISVQVMKRTSRRALTKTTLYPIVKRIGTIIGVKVTKASFAKGVSKAVPIVGGIVSGGTSYISMKHMGNRLREVLSDSLDYTEEDYNKDLKEVYDEVINVNYSEE